LAKNATVAGALTIAAFGLVLYTPLAYLTDSWVYRRNQKRRAQS
jgi:hypothetical protein